MSRVGDENPYRTPVGEPTGMEIDGSHRASVSDWVTAVFLGLLAATITLPVSLFVTVVFLYVISISSRFQIATMPIVLFCFVLSILVGHFVAYCSIRGARNDRQPTRFDQASCDEVADP